MSEMTPQPGQGDLAGLVAAVRSLAEAPDDAARIDQIRLLEELRSAAAATQARITAGFAASQRAATAAATAHLPVEARRARAARAERSIASQVALARKMSPHHAQRYVGFANILTTELPGTFAALAAGATSEWRSLLVARETAYLSRQDRAAVDTELAPKLAHLGDRRTGDAARAIAYRLDPAGAVERMRNADKDRRVSLRPAPDTMTRLTALLPLAGGVASIAALGRDADALKAAGDPRGRGQIMADLLVERITGRAAADGMPVEVNLLMPLDTLLDPDATEPAHLVGHGPIPAPAARAMVLGGQAPVWLRRVFTHPATGELAAMESRRRLFTPAQRRFVEARDQVCRSPWCEAPIRHTDHVIPAEAGGATSIANAQGLCAACNYAKESDGWLARPGPAGRVTITTPTGHRYRSRPPTLPGTDPPAHGFPGIRVDVQYFAHHTAA
jgi:hypothetical protein